MRLLREILERQVRELPPGRRLRQELARASIERFADGRPIRVLDAGAGEGLLATALGRRHPDWTVAAVDLSDEALSLGRELAAERRAANVRFERAGLRVERVRPTTRGTLQLAEELRDRVRDARLSVRAAAFPLVRTALALERAGATWGPARGFYVEARKPL